MKKAVFYLLTLAIPAVTFLILFEIIVPKLTAPAHLTYKIWGARPVTFYPQMSHRAVTENYDINFRSNSLGFNDVEHSLEKKAGVFRVLLLGDSYIEGAGVPPNRHIARIIEELGESDGKRVEVISMGMSGWGQSHHLATYDRIGRKFDPDLVITFFCVNDMWNNRQDENTGWTNGEIYKTDGESLVLRLANIDRPETITEKFKHSFLHKFEGYFLIRKAGLLLHQNFIADNGEIEMAKLAAHGTTENEDSESRDILATNEEIELFKKLVQKMKTDIGDRDGKKLIGVLVSSAVNKKPSAKYLELLDIAQSGFSNAKMKTINLDDIFRKRFEAGGKMPSWETDSHWNEDGHRQVAQILYNRTIKKP